MQTSSTSREMSVQKALLARLPTDASKVWSIEENRPIPSVADNEVRIRHAVVALNPYDWKGVKYKFSLQTEPKVLGRDGSGTIVAVGRKVRRLQVGDKVGSADSKDGS
jgi:NADPH:quinone reductase-like Zn-dependent oxidoreductase